MFTGIVEELGEVSEVADLGDAVRLSVTAATVTSDLGHGDSVSVSGCCLTVVSSTAEAFTADVMKETLDKTTLGTLTPGSPVNLERPVTAASRMGGHIVQGHVDGLGTVLERQSSSNWDTVRVGLDAPLAGYLAVKGSVAVDGVSLTVVDVDDAGDVDDTGSATPSFVVGLIPTTLQQTTLGTRSVGDRVNLEVDVLAKYVERLVNRKESW
ncbi:MAG: riboflavin synthase [Nocardioidaceae bacterium]